MRKLGNEDYYIGLDIGTESVGWAVTDSNYRIPKIKGKLMWGIRLFEAANTAAERRVFRSSRRRLQRKKRRIDLLQELFAEEIYKVDQGFYQRLKDSKYLSEDKSVNQTNTLFNDENFKDEEFHKKYKTIYHLRKELIANDDYHDVRLVYLAIHHILKHRGHFLFEGKSLGVVSSFDQLFKELCDTINENLNIEFEVRNIDAIEKVLRDNKMTNTDKKREILNEVSSDKESTKKVKEIVSLLVGLKCSIAYIFDNVNSDELKTISFSDTSYDDSRDKLESIVSEKICLIDKVKAIYDWSILCDVLNAGDFNGKKYLSVAKMNLFDKHNFDLDKLKRTIKKYGTDKEYYEMFHSDDEACSYAALVGKTKIKGKKISLKKCSREDFYKYVKKVLKNYDSEDKNLKYILGEIDRSDFLPLLKDTFNSAIPYQVHLMELEEILNNASKYLNFLNFEDDNGISIKDKILKIFLFRIPYYVGPINDYHKKEGSNCWIVKKEPGKIFPWNFEEKVDLEASDENFIRRMTNKCTYLIGEDVLPKNSLLYSEFMVLNELNNVRINNEKISNELKKTILTELFLKKKKVTGNTLLKFLQSEGYEISKEQITGFDIDFKSSLTSFIDFEKIGIDLSINKNKKMVEKIIFWITVHTEGGKVLERLISREYGSRITEEQLTNICKIKYKGWGRLSKKVLVGIIGVDKETGEKTNIITALRESNSNFMQMLSERYTYREEINQKNELLQNDIGEVTYDNLVDDLYVSPSVKRGIWQTVLITEEIKKITGREPKKIFVEMARGPEEKKRTKSRKNQLLELYKSVKKDQRDWIDEIKSKSESDFRSKKLYLYYTQLGKCMYTGNEINLENLFNKNIYDIDHIYPQSKTKDDSILNNLVLVEKTANAQKKANIVAKDIRTKMKSLWLELLKLKLITKEKYIRLTRDTNLSNEELARFINRQLVETRQSTKEIANLMRRLYKDSEIVYVKARSVSEFRQNELKIVKVREINDLHHAKDAYLNIVVGNVYHTKFTNNPYRWLNKNKEATYSLNKMYSFDLYENGHVVWRRGKEGSIKEVKETMKSDRILYTRHSYINKGMMFNQQAVKKGKATIQFKKGDKYDVSKYGGYESVKTAYFTLFEFMDKGKRKKKIEVVPIYLANLIGEGENKLVEYFEKQKGYSNVNIIIPCIKKCALLKIDGYPMHIKSSTGLNISLQNAVQLSVQPDVELYLKKIFSFIKRSEENRNKGGLKICKFDSITYDDNIKIYDYLISKHKDTIYSRRPAGQILKLINAKEIFEELSLEKQCVVISEIVKLFACKPILSNLTLIKGSGQCGRIQKNKTISNFKSVELIHQSPTGIFEKKVKLI